MYTLLGAYPVIPAADLLNLQSAANRPGVGNSRTGSTPQVLGKKAGLIVARDSSGISLVFALGDKSSDGWRAVDGSASYTPTNLGAYTTGADSTYSAGLLTTDGGNDAAGRTSQSLALKAGKYLVSGKAASEGASAAAYKTARIRVGTDASTNIASIATKIVGATQRHATAAEDAPVKEDFGFVITVASDATIYFTVDVVDQAGALAAGSAFITINPLEAA